MKRIAVASQNRVTVTSHTGRCRRFWIYDVHEGHILRREMVETGKEETLHACHHRPHPVFRTDVLISSGMGEGLVRRLALHNVRGIVTSESQPDVAVRKYLLGTLEVLPPEPHAHGHHDLPAEPA